MSDEDARKALKALGVDPDKIGHVKVEDSVFGSTRIEHFESSAPPQPSDEKTLADMIREAAPGDVIVIPVTDAPQPTEIVERAKKAASEAINLYWQFNSDGSPVEDVVRAVIDAIGPHFERIGRNEGREDAAIIADTFGDPELRDAILASKEPT